jgi:pimeloyl-ACP methyl ester carboxylesterase
MRRALAVLVLAGACAAVAAAAAAPPRVWHRCVLRGDHAHVLRFKASDGTKLVGAVWGKGTRGVVLAHGRPADLCMWVPYARRLAASGFRVLAFDFRGAGLSDAPHYPRSIRLDLDVAAAVAALRRDGAASVVPIGTSYGGPAAFVAAARLYPRSVGGVIGLSSIDSSTILNAADAVSRSDVPVQLVATTGDGDIDVYARAIYAASTSPDKQLLIVPGYEHSTAIFFGPEGRRVEGEMLRFLRAHTR